MTTNDYWLTRVQLNMKSREARRDIANTGELHRTVMCMFPSVPDSDARKALGVLHRLDTTRSCSTLLVQSSLRPNLTSLPPGYGKVATTSMEPLFERLGDGLGIRYRIVVNATKRIWKGPSAGKRVSLNADDLREWWARRSEAAGLDLRGEMLITPQTLTGASSRKHDLVFRPWRLDGSALVRDSEALAETVKHGIGRGKAYGCGLLSLRLTTAPIR